MAGHKPINYDNIPTELKALPQWVWWLGGATGGKLRYGAITPGGQMG